jgi:hypothetical protein
MALQKGANSIDGCVFPMAVFHVLGMNNIDDIGYLL